MRDMLGSIGLEQLLILDEKMVQNHKTNAINFPEAQEKLDALINSSKTYLSNALKQ